MKSKLISERTDDVKQATKVQILLNKYILAEYHEINSPQLRLPHFSQRFSQ